MEYWVIIIVRWEIILWIVILVLVVRKSKMKEGRGNRNEELGEKKREKE